jgi:hypothetical protein
MGPMLGFFSWGKNSKEARILSLGNLCFRNQMPRCAFSVSYGRRTDFRICLNICFRNQLSASYNTAKSCKIIKIKKPVLRAKNPRSQRRSQFLRNSLSLSLSLSFFSLSKEGRGWGIGKVKGEVGGVERGENAAAAARKRFMTKDDDKG